MKKIFTLLVMLVAMVATSQAATPDYLCFSLPKALSIRNIITSKISFNINGTLTTIPKLQYSKDLSTWTSYTFGDEISVASGERVYFRASVNTSSVKDVIASGKNATFSEKDTKYINFASTGIIYASGNIMSLLDATCKQTSVPESAFTKLFMNCSNLKTAPELPATTLAYCCYEYMFVHCKNLTTAPELPATTLAHSCYSGMFYDCTGLTKAPDLPATTLANYCYHSMFKDCTSLTEAPELPATDIRHDYCYDRMFYNCTKLSSIRVRFTDSEWGGIYRTTQEWVDYVGSTGIFYCPKDLVVKFGYDYIPKGWTVKDIDNPTGVETVHSAEFTDHSSAAYNLAGQRVGANARGIIIKNGKKYLK